MVFLVFISIYYGIFGIHKVTKYGIELYTKYDIMVFLAFIRLPNTAYNSIPTTTYRSIMVFLAYTIHIDLLWYFLAFKVTKYDIRSNMVFLVFLAFIRLPGRLVVRSDPPWLTDPATKRDGINKYSTSKCF